jgi:peptidoglycan-associated lipoprotein
MKRNLTLALVILVVLLPACANTGTSGEAGKRSEAARQEAARQEEALKQEEARIQEEARKQEEVRKQEEARKQEAIRQEEARKQEEVRKQEEARKQDEALKQEQVRKQEEARKQEEVRKQEEARKQSDLAQIEALRRQRLEDHDDPSLIGMVTEEELKKADPLLVDRKIYFDFDRYDIKPNYVPIIAAHVRFLIAHPTVKVFVEGNCDDRGSPEYNIALGQRRSESVVRALLALGVPARQVEAVSYGAEKPAASGSNEESWAMNRRADIAYPILKR